MVPSGLDAGPLVGGSAAVTPLPAGRLVAAGAPRAAQALAILAWEILAWAIRA
jgi:hypothetical protein